MSDHTPDESYEVKLKQAELGKLEAETKALNQSHFSKPANWVPLLAAAGAIMTALAQCQTSELRIQEATLTSQQEALTAERAKLDLERQLWGTNEELRNAERKLLQAREERREAESQKETLEKQIMEQEEERKRQQDLLARLEKQIQERAAVLAQTAKPEEIKEIDRKISETVSELKCVRKLDFAGNWTLMRKVGTTWVPCEVPKTSIQGEVER